MLKDFSTLEAEVTSHAEAVLQGRLSQSQQRLIRNEQLKNCAPLTHTTIASSNDDDKRKISGKLNRNSNHRGTSLIKSKSFRRVGAPTNSPATGRKQSQTMYKYRKNKTTHLDKLGGELDKTATPVVSNFRSSGKTIDNKSYESTEINK